MKAQYSELPYVTGDGYDFGGGADITFETKDGSVTVVFGEGTNAHKIAKLVASAVNSSTHNPD